MRVLGISPLDKDSTVSFMEDGQVIFACAEERLSRVKLQEGFPRRALQLGLERTGWPIDSIDLVAYGFFDGQTEGRLIEEDEQLDRKRHGLRATAASVEALRAELARPYRVDRTREIPGFEREEDEFLPPKSWPKRTFYRLTSQHPVLDGLLHRILLHRWVTGSCSGHNQWTRELHACLEDLGLGGKLRRFNHHDTHAANSFYASGFDRALIVTLDGYGSGNCGGVYVGGPEGLEPLVRFRFPNSLGQHYENVTSALGFKPSRHEGKIVGLAAYGNPEILRKVIRERFEVHNGDLQIRGNLNSYFPRALASWFAKRDIAAAYQAVLEEVTSEVVGYWVRRSGLSKVAMSGGVNANVKLNQRVRELPGVDEVFIYPNMGDGGCGTGAAMLALGHETMYGKAIDTVYYGPDFTEDQMAAALRAAELSFERCGDVEDRIASCLAAKAIVGRFNGRMEYGPRALGNRSVLYPAQDPHVNQWLNHQLGRTEFMPFAPAALADQAHRLFRNLDGCEKTAEFMTITFDCTEEMKRMCPAAVHVDGTARPQLVSERTNPSFHRILRGYYERTGIPALINTSFNMHEEPIVCSPEDAIRAFLLGKLDYLAMGPFLAVHPGSRFQTEWEAVSASGAGGIRG
jgi:carbamoyltransferase